jgi:hypothetical protein
MRKIIVVALFLVHLEADLINVTLKDYVAIVAKEIKMSILITDTLDKEISFYIDNNIDKSTYLDMLYEVLELNDLSIYKKDKFYVIEKLKKQNKSITLDNLSVSEVVYILDSQNVNYKYLPSVNKIFLNSNGNNYFLNIR